MALRQFISVALVGHLVSFCPVGGAVAWAQPAADGSQQSSDELMLDRAEAACRARSEQEFFDAFIVSPAVRERYSASTISVVEEDLSEVAEGSQMIAETAINIAFDNYRGFPIRMEDYYRKRAIDPANGAAANFVEIDLLATREGGFKVEWAEVVYRGESQGGDDLGTAYHPDGTLYDRDDEFGRIDGVLWFLPTRDCWILHEDRRFIFADGN